MTEEELYAGAGEVTRKCLDDILESEYGFVQDDEETYTSEYLLTYPCKTFAEGLTDTLLQHGFSGQADDAKEKIAYVRECCKQRGVTLNPEVIKSWFCGTRPNSGERSRDSLFRLCFALEMDGVDTAVFLLKSCLCRPFNYKNTNEAVYFYCLSKGLRYGDARRIIARVEEAQKSVPEGNVCTEQIGQELEIMRDEDDLVEYLTTHTYTKEKWHYSARNEIKDLLKSCKELARYDTGNDFVDVGLEEASEKKSAVRGNDSLLNTIYGFRASVRKGDDGLSAKNDYDFPEFLRDNWISKQSLYNVMNGKDVSDEVYRKALIILSFYNFYAALYKEKGLWAHYAEFDADEKFEKCSCANEFEAELDERLESCGYSQLYKRNPFDWFILHCAAFPNPLRYFRETLADYYRE